MADNPNQGVETVILDKYLLKKNRYIKTQYNIPAYLPNPITLNMYTFI